MITTGRITDVRRELDAARAAGRRVGFVPTMGALHEGHLSLVRRARAECDLVCVSIFVNPTQFGPREDLAAYPRPLEADLAACEREKVDVVFVPADAEMYPDPPLTRVEVTPLSAPMEGRRRPGHFDGVALVVCKLFNIVGPCRAYFGEKDAQQLRVVRRMTADLNLPVEVVGCPTVRDADGLALSSRNAYLDPEERERALSLSRALVAVRDGLEAGRRSRDALRDEGLKILRGAVDEVDYLELVDPDTLEAVAEAGDRVLVCVAARVGRTRLIDNKLIEVPAMAGRKTPEGEG
jgi:pantoate--beta-alanine ligase